MKKPSQYLGTEINSIKKDPGQTTLKIALAFPDLYEIGTSHFGIQILYHILNRHPEIMAERVYAPGFDYAGKIKENNILLSSIESKIPLTDFDIIGFSLLYELNYTNILYMLDLAGIPFFAKDRDEYHPLIIAGGPSMCNPEPVSDFFDAIVVGEAENVIMEMSEIWLDDFRKKIFEKEIVRKKWTKLEGVYVPALYRKRSEHQKNDKKIRRAKVADLNEAPFPDTPMIPYGKPVHDRLRIEIARGCTRGCRFCQAGMIYRPVRERSFNQIMELSEKCLANTGYDDISLLSLSAGDYTQIQTLLETLMDVCEKEKIAVSFPSLRAGTLTPELMEQVKRVRKTGFTIAPEAGSQRLRNVINKNISEEEIVETAKNAFDAGWRLIKLYFMIGLPTETERDLEEIVELVKKIAAIQKGKQKPKINVSISTFIPKPHTPFQWCRQILEQEAKEKIDWLKKRLHSKNIQIKWQQPKVSVLEGLFARGDRKLANLLVNAYNKGCVFDGWSDCFDFDKWMETIDEAGIDVNKTIGENRDIMETLPWDHIDMGLRKEFLISEYRNATTETVIGDCRYGECHKCGVCDFNHIGPVLSKSGKPGKNRTNFYPGESGEKKRNLYYTGYTKRGSARFFGHLELVKIIIRALKRAKIPVQYSNGFHPMPKISFKNPLPVGMESNREGFIIELQQPCHPVNMLEAVNREMPEGIVVLECYEQTGKNDENLKEKYLVRFEEEDADKDRIIQFFNAESVPIYKNTKSGRQKKIDLKNYVTNMERITLRLIKLELEQKKNEHLRAKDVIQEIFSLDEERLKHIRILKL